MRCITPIKICKKMKVYLAFFDILIERRVLISAKGETALENELLKKLLDRDESALVDIQKNYGKMIYALSFRILGSREDAEECANDVLLEIWNTVPPRQPEKLSAYACMLTRRTAIDKLRANTADKRGGTEYLLAMEELEGDLCVCDSATEDIDSYEISAVINEFLGSVKPRDRYIFIARYYAFEEISDIAAKLGMAKNAVNIRLSRMRKQLGALFAERNIYI